VTTLPCSTAANYSTAWDKSVTQRSIDTMTLHEASPFAPPLPPIPENELSWYGFLKAVRTNALEIWPKRAYREDVLVQSFLGRTRILLNTPAAIQRVLVENTANYRRTPASIRILRPVVGEGLILSEGDAWRHQRRTIAPALTPRIVPVLARHVIEAADEAIARLAAEHGPVDLLAAVQLLTLEIAARSMFSLEMQRYGAALRRLMAQFAVRLARPYLFDMLLPATIPTLRDLARMRFRGRWVALMDEIIAARLAAEASESPRDLFDVLLAARDPQTGAAFSRAQLRDQVATMIVAGHETTALTVFWSMFLLASAPAEQERVFAEACAIELTVKNAAEALPELPYTRAVVSEALRLYPPAYLIARVAIRADAVGDARIPRGTLVMISPWVLHRHVALWSNPDAFEPSRFLGDGQPAPRLAYLPFGAGPRVCVGATFALAEATLVLATLIRHFQVSLADARPVLPMAVITTQPDHPAPFHLRKRQGT
jgi:unspecific monooxygenase